MPPIEAPGLPESPPDRMIPVTALPDTGFDDLGYEAALPYLWRSGTVDDFADSAFSES